LLHKGCYLVGTIGSEGTLSAAPDHQDAVPIEQVFEALVKAGGRGVRSTGARHEFHGDGVVDEHVDVVSIYGGLGPRSQASSTKYLVKPTLTAADIVPSSFRGAGQGDTRVSCALCQDTSIQESSTNDDEANAVAFSEGMSGLPLAIAVEELRKRKVNHAISLVPAEILSHLAQDTGFSQAVLDCGVRDTKVLSNLENALTTAITCHEVLHVERYGWSGHVYNLQTEQNWYSLRTGGIIAHNCMHAEENAIINCRVGRSEAKVVFCTNLPCPMCAKRLINLGGVKHVFYLYDYRNREGLDFLTMANIQYGQLTLE
jgi:deoxycytidylate deaminase